MKRYDSAAWRSAWRRWARTALRCRLLWKVSWTDDVAEADECGGSDTTDVDDDVDDDGDDAVVCSFGRGGGGGGGGGACCGRGGNCCC